MVKNNKFLAKSINDAEWKLFQTILAYKVAEIGKRVVEVEVKNTSQLCSNCGELKELKLKLSQRKFSCFKRNY
jgi:putative transposase